MTLLSRSKPWPWQRWEVVVVWEHMPGGQRLGYTLTRSGAESLVTAMYRWRPVSPLLLRARPRFEARRVGR